MGREKLSPHIAVFKNIMTDHLNYYGSMEKYLADKKFIFSNQKPKDWLVINYDDEALKILSGGIVSQVIKFSYKPLSKNRSIFIDDEKIYINTGVDVVELISLKDILIPGKHNYSNVMAAVGAVYAYGLSPLQIKKALPLLRGVPHRLEFVRELDGVKYYNDTAATIPDATISALNSFEQPIVLVVGGTDKNLQFSELAKAITEKAKNVVMLKGTATEKIISQMGKDFAQNLEVVDSMEKAVISARKLAEKGDVVLLSPGAASFGLFLNEFDRGEKFRDTVKKLK